MALTLSAIIAPPPFPGLSPLMLADRLIGLAQDADRAGYHDAASQLVGLVYAVLDEALDRRAPSVLGAIPGFGRAARM